MVLFFVAIRRDLVSLLKFPFLSHLRVFPCEISLVGHLKRPFRCFSFYFCFLFIVVLLVLMLSVLFLVVVISLPPRFCMESLNRCIHAITLSSILVSTLPPSFLDTYFLSTSSLECNALSMVISFLVLWSICLSSFLVHFKNGLEYLTRGIRFLLCIFFFSSSFLVLLRYSLFLFITTCLMVSVSNINFYHYFISCEFFSPFLIHVYCQFSPWYRWLSWYHFVLDLKEIQFLSWGFTFLAMSRFSHVQYPQFVACKSEVGDRRRGWPEDSFFNSYYTKV